MTRKGDVFYLEEKRDRLIQYDFMKSAIKRQIMNCFNNEHYNAGIYVVTKQKINNMSILFQLGVIDLGLMNFNVNKQLYLKYTVHAQYTTIILLNCDLLLIV